MTWAGGLGHKRCIMQAEIESKPLVTVVALDGPLAPGRSELIPSGGRRMGLEQRFRRDLNVKLGSQVLAEIVASMPRAVGDLVLVVLGESHGLDACPTIADVISARRVVAAMLDPCSADDLADRVDGKPTQKVEVMSDVRISIGLPPELLPAVELRPAEAARLEAEG